MMTDFIPTGFHFIRPEWLLALVPAMLLYIVFFVLGRHSSQWGRAVNRDLLVHLLDGGKSGGRSGLLTFLVLGWIFAAFAMAGPAWNKLPQPVHEKNDALVIIQDLSLSFFAQDLSPDRITRARHKLVDLLKARKEGTTALIAYSGDAHTIVPLTDDIRTIENMVPALSPSIMPGFGSNVVEAVRKGLELLKNGAGGQGRMLLITDEVTRGDVKDVIDILHGRSVSLSVIGVGTENGGPIPQKEGGFWKDKDGNIIVPKMDRSLLKEMAENSGGRYSDIKLTDNDIEYLLADDMLIVPEGDYQRLEREFDTWQDMGSRLVLLILPLALMAFRRGLIIALLMVIVLSGTESHAMSWQDLWLTRDQQAARAMRDGEYKNAADTFKTPLWKGAAEYKAGEYSKAADAFSGIEGVDGYYNRGNALAKGGKLDEAIQAYNKALELNPNMKDALHNRDLVQKLMEQQKQQDQQQNSKNKDGEDKDGEKKDGSNESKDQNQQGNESEKGGEQQEQQQGKNGEQDKENRGPESEGESKDDMNTSANPENKQKTGKEKKENESEEKKDASQSAMEQTDKQENADEEPAGSVVEGKLSDEEQQAVEQLLRKIPDDPGGLLRRKFEYEYQQNHGRVKSNKNNKIW